MRKDIEFAVNVLSKLSEPTTEERLRRAATGRAEIMAVLKAGGVPQGPRWEWLMDACRQIHTQLGIITQEFDAKFPDDVCTMMDLIDILSLVEKNLREIVQKVDEPPKS